MGLVTASKLEKTYCSGDVEVKAIRGIDFSIPPASFVAFVGPSGSLQVLGQEVGDLERKEAAAFRGEHIGFIFQDFNLVPVLSAYENIEYPLFMVQDWLKAKRRSRVMELLEAVDMADQACRFNRSLQHMH